MLAHRKLIVQATTQRKGNRTSDSKILLVGNGGIMAGGVYQPGAEVEPQAAALLWAAKRTAHPVGGRRGNRNQLLDTGRAEAQRLIQGYHFLLRRVGNDTFLHPIRQAMKKKRTSKTCSLWS